MQHSTYHTHEKRSLVHTIRCAEGTEGKGKKRVHLYCCKNDHVMWYVNDTGICPFCGYNNSNNPRDESPTNPT